MSGASWRAAVSDRVEDVTIETPPWWRSLAREAGSRPDLERGDRRGSDETWPHSLTRPAFRGRFALHLHSTEMMRVCVGACIRSSPTSTAVVGAGVTPSSL